MKICEFKPSNSCTQNATKLKKCVEMGAPRIVCKYTFKMFGMVLPKMENAPQFSNSLKIKCEDFFAVCNFIDISIFLNSTIR